MYAIILAHIPFRSLELLLKNYFEAEGLKVQRVFSNLHELDVTYYVHFFSEEDRLKALKLRKTPPQPTTCVSPGEPLLTFFSPPSSWGLTHPSQASTLTERRF